MKVYELIAKLQQMPPDAEMYVGWTEVNDSGTAWDTGSKAYMVEQEPGGKGKPDHVVIR